MNEKNNPASLLDVIGFTADKIGELACQNGITGQPIEKDGITLIPVQKVSIGFAGGGSDCLSSAKGTRKSPAGCGGKVELTPVCYLSVCGDRVEIVPTAPQEEASPGILSSLVSGAAALLAARKQKKEQQKENG